MVTSVFMDHAMTVCQVKMFWVVSKGGEDEIVKFIKKNYIIPKMKGDVVSSGWLGHFFLVISMAKKVSQSTWIPHILMISREDGITCPDGRQKAPEKRVHIHKTLLNLQLNTVTT